MKSKNVYSFMSEFWEDEKLLIAVTIFSCILDGVLIYTSNISAYDPTLYNVILCVMMTIAAVAVWDGLPIFIGSIVGRFFRIPKRAYLIMISVMIVLMSVFYFSIASTAFKAAEIPKEQTQDVDENLSDVIGIITAEDIAEVNDGVAAITEAKEKVAKQSAWTRTLTPINTSAFILILSMASARTRRKKRIEEQLQVLYTEREKLSRELMQYVGMPNEEKLIEADNRARESMDTRLSVFLESWKKSVLMPLAVKLGDPIATADLLQASYEGDK